MALAALKGEKTLLELAQQFDVLANQIIQWKSQLLKGAAGVFGGDAKAEPAEAGVDVKTLDAKIEHAHGCELEVGCEGERVSF